MAMLGFALVATTSSIAIAATGSRAARISATERTLAYGEKFRLGGSVPADRGMDVRIKFRPAGADGWRFVRKTHSDRHGTYVTRLRARVNGALRAIPARGHASRPEAIEVRSRTAFHVASHHLKLGRGVRLQGRARPGGRRAVKVVVRGPGGDVTFDRTRRTGRFALAWKPRRAGTYRLRAFTARNRKARGSASVVRRVTAYRPAQASWYGPGFWGGRTACGQTLTSGMLGVAHKSMPCGTRLRLRYGGRTVRVRVIDRGPYSGSREFDLTQATKERLRFPDLGTVWTSK
jgi:rare lipoprotein A